ncbi:unnamed protein product [Trichogramma brassicae]|uniref:F-box domain-containing protein n=1 Tax=Trichogramma brassicae TaxID=86971 RepID=A0A6H5HY37_9HYME|nr:unnamed protein product [Trichogramma brassicae]
MKTLEEQKFENKNSKSRHKCVECDEAAELLLRAGDADPNISAKEDGSTPLHVCCKRDDGDEFVRIFFEIADEKHQLVRVDAKDKLGRTPLQWAVANLLLGAVDLLLDRGADLSSFVFPTEDYFDVDFDSSDCGYQYRLKRASRVLSVVERLEKRGYEPDRAAVLTIMKFFAKHGLFEMSAKLHEKSQYLVKFLQEDEAFANKARELTIEPSLTFYDLISLPAERAKKSLTYADCARLASSNKWFELSMNYILACLGYLCETMLGKFCQRWFLDDFSELTRHRLPILCSDIVIEKLSNEDLFNVCLAQGRSIIEFVARCGYKDEPPEDLDEDGKPSSSRRTTPLHLAHRNQACVYDFFKIYDRYDVNYTDESGLSHFRIACDNGCSETIEKFLEHGLDVNRLIVDPPLHRALSDRNFRTVRALLVNGADPNLADEAGLTPLHVYCRDCPDGHYLLAMLLQLGQDKYEAVRVQARDRLGNTPLHYALARGRGRGSRTTEFLLRRGADPNAANAKGETPLHVVCSRVHRDDDDDDDDVVVDTFLSIVEEQKRTLRVDARDELGNAPLHRCVLAGAAGKKAIMIEWLLRRGADANSINEAGSTPLHVVCDRSIDDDLIRVFLKIVDEEKQTVQIDARDNLGRTPLQCAVANLLPSAVDVLLKRGADLSGFVFPTESHFVERFQTRHFEPNFRLRLASGLMAILERLQKEGCELQSSDALAIMKFFATYGLFETDNRLVGRLLDDKEFSFRTQWIVTIPGLSFCDLLQLPADEAAKRLACTDYFEFSARVCRRLTQNDYETCARHLAERLSRRFFLRSALDPFWKLIHLRLPVEMCELILQQLTNEDLFNICLAATGQN